VFLLLGQLLQSGEVDESGSDESAEMDMTQPSIKKRKRKVMEVSDSSSDGEEERKVTDSPSRAQRLANRQAASAASLSLHMSQPTQKNPVITQASTQLNKEVAARNLPRL
jgi:hypothetical protein